MQKRKSLAKGLTAQKILAFLLSSALWKPTTLEGIKLFVKWKNITTRDCIKETVGGKLHIWTSLGIQRKNKCSTVVMSTKVFPQRR